MEDQVEGESGAVGVGLAAHGAELTDRDKQLVGYLAVVRFLSSGQVQRLVYPGRLMKVCRRRLLRLAGLWKTSPRARAPANSPNENLVPPYLRRREVRALTGELLEIWALTDHGYWLAERVLGRPLKMPRSDVSADHLERIVGLNEFFVGMLDPSAHNCVACGAQMLTWRLAKLAKAARLPGAELLRRAGQDDYVLVCGDEQRRGCKRVVEASVPRAQALPFEWTTSEGVQLPWTEYDRRTGKTYERMLRPDAMLVIPRERRRLFIESDILVAFGDGEQSAAAVAKADRYASYVGVSPTSEHSFYARRFGDGFAPELKILVSSSERAATVNAALATWDAKARPALRVRAHVTEELVRELHGLPGTDANSRPRRPDRALNTGEVDALKRFFGAVIGPVKLARANARANGAPVPEYPPEAQKVGEILNRLLSATGPHR
jgi:hypothetical protein